MNQPFRLTRLEHSQMLYCIYSGLKNGVKYITFSTPLTAAGVFVLNIFFKQMLEKQTNEPGSKAK